MLVIYLILTTGEEFRNSKIIYIFLNIYIAESLSQRLNKNTVLFQGNRAMFLLKIPKGNYTKGYRYVGIVKGTGAYKYTSLSNALEIIPQGKVLTIHLQQ